MCVPLKVYDLSADSFRDLNPQKYNEDLNVAVIFFENEVMKEIEKYYTVCGYVIIDNVNHMRFPIDIQNRYVCLFESAYNFFPTNHQKLFAKYFTCEIPKPIFSRFFFEWQFASEHDCFKKNGSFIELCSSILYDSRKIKKMITKSISIYEPSNYAELSIMVQRLIKLSNVNIFTYDYQLEFKYLIDSLLKNYHINFKEEDIIVTWEQVCTVILDNWGKL